MKRFITILAAFAAVALSSYAAVPHGSASYTGVIGTRYEVHGGEVEAVPLICTITLSEQAAIMTYDTKTGENLFIAKAVRRVSETEWLFRGFKCILPDGTSGRILSAGLIDDGVLMIAFDVEGEYASRAYTFTKN